MKNFRGNFLLNVENAAIHEMLKDVHQLATEQINISSARKRTFSKTETKKKDAVMASFDLMLLMLLFYASYAPQIIQVLVIRCPFDSDIHQIQLTLNLKE